MSGIWLVSYIGLWMLVVVQTLVFLAVLRQVGVLHTRIEPRPAMGMDTPPLGEVLSDEEFVTIDGTSFSLRATGKGRRLFALFVSPGCSVCDEIMPSFRALFRGSSNGLEGAVVVAATPRDASEWAARSGWTRDVVAAPDVLEKLRIRVTPFGVVVDEDGRVQAGGVANTLEQLESLLLPVRLDEHEHEPEEEPGSHDGRGKQWEKASIN